MYPVSLVYYLSNLYNNHKILVEQIICIEFNDRKRIEVIKYNKLDLEKGFNVLLLSKFLDYKNKVSVFTIPYFYFNRLSKELINTFI